MWDTRCKGPVRLYVKERFTLGKKSSSLVPIIAFVAGTAAVGAACYIYRDKIQDFMEKNDVKGKVDTVKDKVGDAKTYVTNKFQKKSEDEFDDEEFFDDDDADSSERGYTSITITSEDEEEDGADEDAEDETSEASELVSEAAEAVTESVTSAKKAAEDKLADVSSDLKEAGSKAKEEAKEALASVAKKAEEALDEESPEDFEYEGLSDVSEDEDVLADEAALDGAK